MKKPAWMEMAEKRPCAKCGGTGQIEVSDDYQETWTRDCPLCNNGPPTETRTYGKSNREPPQLTGIAGFMVNQKKEERNE